MNVQDIDWKTFDLAALSADEREALKQSALRRAHDERARAIGAVPRQLVAWLLRPRPTAIRAATASRLA